MSTSLSEFKPILPQPSLLSSPDRERIAEIAATIGAAYQHGCIYFGICNNRLKIEAVEEALEKSLAAKGIAISRVALAERYESDGGPQYRARISDPITYLTDLAERERTLFFIHGLPELIRAQTDSDYSRVAPVSQLLNYRRELFHDRALCTFFWIDPETVAYLRQNARDFWAFRSGAAYFLEAESPIDRRLWALGHEDLGPTGPYAYWGDHDEKLSQLAAYRRRSPPDDNAIGNLLLDIGRLHAERHESEKALQALHEALATFERVGLKDRVRDTELWLARAFEDAGRLDKAEACLREAVEIDEGSGDVANLATDYNNLSQVYYARSELDEADKWLRKAIEIGERLRHEPQLATHYNNLSAVYLGRGQLDEAEKWLRKAIEIGDRLGDEPSLAIRYNNLSEVYEARGRLEEAEVSLRKAIEIDERLGDELSLAKDYNNLSQIYEARDQLDEAEKWLRKAIQIAERLGDQETLAVLYSNLGVIYFGRRESDEAAKWLRKAIRIEERLGNEPKLAIRYSNLSLVYQDRRDLDEAEKWLRKAISLMEPKGPSAILEGLKRVLEALLKGRQLQTVPKSENPNGAAKAP